MIREKFKLRCHLRYYGVQKGGKMAQLLPSPYMPISSSNGVCTGGFGGSDQKQSLWTSIVSECARPNINIKINGKRFFVFLILDPILLLFPNIYGPNLGLYREFLAKLQEFLKPKHKRFIKVSNIYM